jgi:hypothetical protein
MRKKLDESQNGTDELTPATPRSATRLLSVERSTPNRLDSSPSDRVTIPRKMRKAQSETGESL